MEVKASHPVNCLIANTPSLLQRVFQLRYLCYHRKGSINESPTEIFQDQFDDLCNSISVLAESTSGEAVATVRISVVKPTAGWRDSPAQQVFGDHPQLQAIAAESDVEASRLCFGPHARRDSFVTLLGHMAALAEYYEADWLVACPRVEHSEVYQRMFGFRPLAAARQYFGVNFQTQLLGIRRSELAEYVRAARPMKAAWANALERLVRSAALPTPGACWSSGCSPSGESAAHAVGAS